MPLALHWRDDETVCFSRIAWPSREARDAAVEKPVTDERLDPAYNPMPPDGMRLRCGGFEVNVDE